MFVHTRHQFQKHLQPGDCWSCSVCSCQAEYETRGGKPGNCPSRWPWHIWSHLFVSVPSRRTCTACIPYFVGTPAIEAGSMVYSSQEEHTSLCSPFPADWWGGSQTKTAWLTALKWWQTTNYPDGRSNGRKRVCLMARDTLCPRNYQGPCRWFSSRRSLSLALGLYLHLHLTPPVGEYACGGPNALLHFTGALLFCVGGSNA